MGYKEPLSSSSSQARFAAAWLMAPLKTYVQCTRPLSCLCCALPYDLHQCSPIDCRVLHFTNVLLVTPQRRCQGPTLGQTGALCSLDTECSLHRQGTAAIGGQGLLGAGSLHGRGGEGGGGGQRCKRACDTSGQT